MQISIDGTDLFPTAGNTATAASGPLDIAIAIGNGAGAGAGESAVGVPPPFFDFSFADGTNSSAVTGGGGFNSAIVIGTNSTAEAGAPENFCFGICPPGDKSDFAAAFGNDLHASATGGSFLTTIDPAPAAAAPSDLNPFEDLFGTAGINTWTTGADTLLNGSDPSQAASLDASVDAFIAAEDAGYVDSGAGPAYLVDPLQSLVGEFIGPSPFLNGDEGVPVTGIGDVAVGLDYEIFASGLAPTLDPALSDALTSLPTLSSDILFWLFFPEDLLGLISLG
jgi:hypothetical protein